MLLLQLIKTVVLGIVEGITEWLPISSTGHMILIDEWLKLDVRPEFMELFLVLIQLGAILAVIILFWNKIWPFHIKKTSVEPFFDTNAGIKGFFNKYIYTDRIILWLKIAVACIPAGVLGILFDDELDSMLTGNLRAFVVAGALIFYGVLFIVIESIKKNEHILSTEQLSFKTAFIIGLFQALSLIPGTSRSGATILGASLLGTSRVVAAEFSFFLSIPAMVGGSFIRLLEFFMDGNVLYTEEIIIVALGFFVAFVVSIFAIKFLVSYIKKHDFKAFGYYRIVLGLFVILYFLLLK